MVVDAPEQEIMTTEEAMKYLDISRDTFFKWRRAGKIMPFNFNEAKERQPNPLYRKADLDAFIAQRRQERLRRQAGTTNEQ